MQTTMQARDSQCISWDVTALIHLCAHHLTRCVTVIGKNTKYRNEIYIRVEQVLSKNILGSLWEQKFAGM